MVFDDAIAPHVLNMIYKIQERHCIVDKRMTACPQKNNAALGEVGVVSSLVWMMLYYRCHQPELSSLVVCVS